MIGFVLVKLQRSTTQSLDDVEWCGECFDWCQRLAVLVGRADVWFLIRRAGEGLGLGDRARLGFLFLGTREPFATTSNKAATLQNLVMSIALEPFPGMEP